MKNFISHLCIFLCLCSTSGLSQQGSVDLTFNPTDVGFGYGNGSDSHVYSTVVLPDGKILAVGDFLYYNSSLKKRIVKINQDGRVDESFNSTNGADSNIDGLILQQDGKILIFGSFYSYGGHSSKYLARLNSNGDFDNTFSVGTGPNMSINSIALQQDGKIIIGGGFTSYNGATAKGIARLNIDGTLDNTFLSGNGIYDSYLANIRDIEVLQDGKLLIAGSFDSYNGISRNNIARINSDGSIDESFNPESGPNNYVNCISIETSGNIILAGAFTSYSGNPCSRICRISSDGNFETSLPVTGVNNEIKCVTLQTDGKILIGGAFTTMNGSAINRIARININGTIDNTFVSGNGTEYEVRSITLQNDGKIVLGGEFSLYNNHPVEHITRLNNDGTVDSAFNPGNGVNKEIYTCSTLGNDKIILGGFFSSVNGNFKQKSALLNSNGTVDDNYNSGSSFIGNVSATAVQPDNKILLAGLIYNYNGNAVDRIVRIHPDGSVDNTFTSNPIVSNGINGIKAVGLQNDGKIIIAGEITKYNGSNINKLARLNQDGTIDNTFNTGSGIIHTQSTPYYEDIAIQTDNKIIVAGYFGAYNGITRNYIARLNTDGSIDSAFNSGAGTNNTIRTVALQEDGKILIGGKFITFNGASKKYIARLNSDGSLDNSFKTGTGTNNEVSRIVVQKDGKILVAGFFTTYNDTICKRLVRLNPDGSIDKTFDIGAGANANINDIAIQANGKIIVVGDFTSFDEIGRNRITRINSSPYQPDDFILATELVEKGATGVTYSVPPVQGVNYIWNYTGEGVIINGSGNEITLDFSEDATSGILEVIADNGCCQSKGRTINIQVNSITGSPETLEKVVRLYPNPNKGNFLIESDELKRYSNFEIINSLGKIVQNGKMNESGLTPVFLNDSKGIYYIILKGERKQSLTFKIIKE